MTPAFTHTSVVNLELPFNPACMDLDSESGGKKKEVRRGKKLMPKVSMCLALLICWSVSFVFVHQFISLQA